MPSRKRSSLSSTSQNAKRMRLNRQNESHSQREERLTSERNRYVSRRSLETREERESRLARDRVHHSRSRASEASTDREFRLSTQRDRQLALRAAESSEDRATRLAADRTHHAHTRAVETSPDREVRLNSQRDRQSALRAAESNEDHTARLTADRTHHAHSRAMETSPDREARLNSQRDRQSALRSAESSEDRAARLAADRMHHEQSRASETSPDREARLRSQRIRQAVTRATADDDANELRIVLDRERHAQSRSLESVEQHQLRLQEARDRYATVREQEQANAIANRQRIHEVRREESAEQQSERRADDRLRHALTRMSISDEDEPAVSESLDIPRPWTEKYMSGFSYNARINYGEYTFIGRMSEICSHCKALKWRGEPKGLCCSAGKVRLEPLQAPPEPLKSLLTGQHPQSKSFLKAVRVYNGAFQMTSFGGKEIREGNFMPCFKIQGQVYHRIGSLLPMDDGVSKFLQVYFISDYQKQVDARITNTTNIDRNIVAELQTLLHENNSFVRDFKSALQSIPWDQQDNFKVVINADRKPVNMHRGRCNEPTTNEVAVVMINEECGSRDIIIRTRSNQLQRIRETHRAYDTLQYPLMFCYGEDGYHFELRILNPTTGQETNKKISALQFYSYRIMVRDGQPNYLLFFCQLLNQFLVDMYAKIEAERLLYIRTNQSRLRSENYIHLQDALGQDVSPENLGRLIILPSSFTGGPRYMHQRTQDAFVYVRKYGRPDLFITITTNPKWEDITSELYPGQVAHERHDIVSRVFHLKLKKLMELLTKQKIFGPVRCHMFTVEWQKRGLPHAHILIWLENKIRPNQMDDVICAEFPDVEKDPILYNIVKSHMIHGPCGELNRQSPCMKDGRCSKRFPKRLTAATITGEDGYPTYRRRSIDDGGHTASIRMRGQTVIVDNRWVVAYSPVLSRAMKTHINVEYCGSIEAIKYLCKYVNKGSDQATFSILNERDEVMRYQSGRYVSTSEAVWRTLGYSIHERFPPVFHLDIHLENGQRIYFNPSNVQERVENPRNTTLTAFFELCKKDPFARTLLYEEIPSYFTFDKRRGVFNRRRRGVRMSNTGVFKDNSLGRVYTVHPNNSECFYLRMLLHTVRGPTSFVDLRRLDGIDYPTFQAACAARHLLEDDQHWDQTLQEACIDSSASKLRQLFSVMLVFCNLSDAKQLWEKYRDSLAEDLKFEMRRRMPETNNDTFLPEIYNNCLLEIQNCIYLNGGHVLAQYGLPTPHAPANAVANQEYASEISYDTAVLRRLAAESEEKLSHEQRQIYEEIMASIHSNEGKMIFLDAPGGTGKTFLINLLLNKVRSQGNIAIAVASSGIAATLLPGGKTAHSSFKIPLNLDYSENPVCDVSKDSNKASVFRDCVFIVWDECTMAHKKSIEAVDRMLRDVRNNERVMGGVTFLFSGDYRQTLPVIPRGTRADEVNACLKRSILWCNVRQYSLRQNMRAILGSDSQAQEFSNTLLSVGDGTMAETDGEIDLPSTLCITVPSIDSLICQVYPDIMNIHGKENSWFCERAILAPKNDIVQAINNSVLDMFEAASKTYSGINSVVEQDEATNYPTEFLNSLNASGLPVQDLKLKVGSPIMLMRNLSPPKLCNGTRLRVKKLNRNVIEATILTGCGRGEDVFIPRIPLIPSNFPFQFKRLQFPVAVCFAMTINKSQGQTLGTVGVDLRTSCFSHGQLYVACSRVSGSSHLYICAPSNRTQNVVYREALI